MMDLNEEGLQEPLSSRELEVLGRLADGMTDDEIAQELYLSANTVKWYNRQIYMKLDVSNRTQAVAQARAFGLLDADPASSSLDHAPGLSKNHLPAQLTSFVGRDHEVADVRALIREKRLITLTGPGGTGKTRLALHAAAGLIDDYAHGVWFVDLAPITQVDRVASAVALAFGLQERDSDIKGVLITYLKSREVLLILDNFEQVIGAADLVGDLLAEAPDLTVIVTSREILQLYGEREYQVPPLALPELDGSPALEDLLQPESMLLFSQRARAANPAFEFTTENAPIVAEICLMLDGLPLAIELAAARIKLFSPEALLERLDDRFATLTGGARNMPERQRTIYNAIRWSYDLLDEDEQVLFARLSVFQSGRNIDAVDAICMEGLEIDPLEGLESLLNKSLIRLVEGVEGEPRFVMLETIHEFARKQLDERGETEVVQRAHATYFVDMATQSNIEYRGWRQPYWNAWLSVERENIRKALEWMVSHEEKDLAVRMVSMLASYWFYMGFHREGLEWYNRVASFKEDVSMPVQMDFLIKGGHILIMLPDPEISIRNYQEGLALARKYNDQRAEAWALQHLAAAHIETEDQDKYREAVRFCTESVETARRLDDQPCVAHGLNVLGELYRVHGERDKARQAYLGSLEIVLETGEEIRELFLYENLGFMAYDEGRYDEALASFKRGVGGFLKLDSIQWVAITLRNLAASQAKMGYPEQGARLMGAAERLGEELGIYVQAGDRSIFDQYERDVRDLLGDEHYDALVEEGRAMQTADVLAFVREVIGDSTSRD